MPRNPTDPGRPLRPSSYLNWVELPGGGALLYNGLSLCIDRVPLEMARGLAEGALALLTPGERRHLAGRGHLTRLSPDGERAAMARAAGALARRDAGPGRRMVTFILTYGCNLACTYCYQAEVRKTAGTAVLDEAFLDAFLGGPMDSLLPAGPGQGTYFQLYGGEPLLPGNRGAIRRILDYAGGHGVPVSAVTNAVLLPDMLDLVGPERGRINILQVTLDGEQLFHNQQRLSCAGTPTFRQTIDAIHAITRAGADAVIRIHVYPDRIGSARLVVDHLEREGILGHPRAKVYFWSTEDLHRQAMPASEFEAFQGLFREVARRQRALPTAHFAFLERVLDLETAAAWPGGRRCGLCVSGLHCVVDPLGDFYECLDDAGRRDRRTGAWSAGKIRRLRPDPKPSLRDRPECLACPVALFCGGGCHNRRNTSDLSPSPFCLQIRDFIGLTLATAWLLKDS